MKIDDILIDLKKIYCHSKARKILERYYYQDVVTSFIYNSFGIAFLIKGKVKPFAFVVLDYPIAFSFNLHEIDVKAYFKLFEKTKRKEGKTIIDEKMLQEIKAKNMLLELNK